MLTLSEDCLGAERGLSDEQMFGTLGDPGLIVQADRYIRTRPVPAGGTGPRRPSRSFDPGVA